VAVINGIVIFLVLGQLNSMGRVRTSLLHTGSDSGLASGTLLLPPYVLRSG
jgi:hypothetical protein